MGACLDARRFLDLQLRLADTADGDTVWVRLRGSRLGPQDDDQPRVHGIVANTSSRALTHEAHSRLAAIVSSSDVAIIGETLDGTITDWNRGAEEIFGYGLTRLRASRSPSFSWKAGRRRNRR